MGETKAGKKRKKEREREQTNNEGKINGHCVSDWRSYLRMNVKLESLAINRRKKTEKMMPGRESRMIIRECRRVEAAI